MDSPDYGKVLSFISLGHTCKIRHDIRGFFCPVGFQSIFMMNRKTINRYISCAIIMATWKHRVLQSRGTNMIFKMTWTGFLFVLYLSWHIRTFWSVKIQITISFCKVNVSWQESPYTRRSQEGTTILWVRPQNFRQPTISFWKVNASWQETHYSGVFSWIKSFIHL